MTPGARQALLLVALSFVIGFGAESFREERLPLSGPLEEPAPPEPGADLPAIEPADAVSAWESGSFLLDVRELDEFETHRVAGAFSFPASGLDDAYFLTVANFGPEMPVVLYGAGADSFTVRRAAQYLIDRGHEDVSLVVCGLEGLLEAGADPGDGPAEEAW